MGRRRKPIDVSKNRKLDEFLAKLEIEADKRERIMEFVENLAFEQLKKASVKEKQFVRLNR